MERNNGRRVIEGTAMEGIEIFTEDVLRKAVEQGAADIFLIPGMPLSWKVCGKIL